MKNTFKILAILLLLSNFSFAQDYTKKIDSLIKTKIQENPTIGVSVGFIQNNIEYYTAYGKINKESNVYINKNSVFEIASITKILTSNLIAQAVIDRKLKLNDFIDNCLPKNYILHKNIRNKIRVSDLASHQSGLTDIDFRKLIALDAQQPINTVTQKTLSDIINNCSELIDYGKYRYSTIGYVLLGQILEQVYGKSYDEIIREKIIEPLQMTNTLTKDFNVKNITTAYNQNEGIQEYFKWHIMASAGLVKSTASDMITYLKTVLSNNNKISQAAIMTEKTHYKDENRELGLGININTDDKNTIYIKTGDTLGQSSFICYNRVENWGIVVLLNHNSSKLRQNILNEIYESILK